jgi:hypothetical protein
MSTLMLIDHDSLAADLGCDHQTVDFGRLYSHLYRRIRDESGHELGPNLRLRPALEATLHATWRSKGELTALRKMAAVAGVRLHPWHPTETDDPARFMTRDAWSRRYEYGLLVLVTTNPLFRQRLRWRRDAGLQTKLFTHRYGDKGVLRRAVGDGNWIELSDTVRAYCQPSGHPVIRRRRTLAEVVRRLEPAPL